MQKICCSVCLPAYVPSSFPFSTFLSSSHCASYSDNFLMSWFVGGVFRSGNIAKSSGPITLRETIDGKSLNARKIHNEDDRNNAHIFVSLIFLSFSFSISSHFLSLSFFRSIFFSCLEFLSPFQSTFLHLFLIAIASYLLILARFISAKPIFISQLFLFLILSSKQYSRIWFDYGYMSTLSFSPSFAVLHSKIKLVSSNLLVCYLLPSVSILECSRLFKAIHLVSCDAYTLHSLALRDK